MRWVSQRRKRNYLLTAADKVIDSLGRADEIVGSVIGPP